MYNSPNDSNNNTNQSWMMYNSAPPHLPVVTWTKYEDKLFEQALVGFPEDLPNRWQKIADRVPGKTAEDVRVHYDALVHDVREIEAGRVELPNYADEDEFFGWGEPLQPPPESRTPNQISFGASGKAKHGDGERKKGTPWTEEEHRYSIASFISFAYTHTFIRWKYVGDRSPLITYYWFMIANCKKMFFFKHQTANFI